MWLKYFRLMFLAVGLGLPGQNGLSTTAADLSIVPLSVAYDSQVRAVPSGEERQQATQNLGELRLLVEAQQRQLQEQAARLEQLEHDVREPTYDPASDMPASNPTDFFSPPNNMPRSCPESTLGFSPPNRGDRSPYPTIAVGGQYRMMFNGANFNFHDQVITDDQRSQSFFNQRFRPWLTVQTNEHVEGYLQMEIGHILWGENFDFPKTYVGPRFPPADDRVGIEMRYGYLTYTTDVDDRWRAGIQPWQDSFDQTLASSDWDFSVGGLSWLTTSAALGDMRLLAGGFVLTEGDVGQADDAILWTLDGDWGSEGGNSLGWSIYVLSDHDQYSYPTVAPYDSAWDVWFGLRATVQTAVAPIHSFFLYNTGRRNELGGMPDFLHNGFAVKLETGPKPFWFGELRFQTLYSTGEDDPDDRSSGEFRTVAQSVRDNFGSQGYWSYLALTSPHGPSDVNDLGVSLQNRGLGLFTIQAAFDYHIHECLASTFAVGWLNADAPNPTSGSRDMGTEILQMLTYDFSGGLKFDTGVAVLFTGDFYRASPVAGPPDVLWEVFSRLQLEF